MLMSLYDCSSYGSIWYSIRQSVAYRRQTISNTSSPGTAVRIAIRREISLIISVYYRHNYHSIDVHMQFVC